MKNKKRFLKIISAALSVCFIVSLALPTMVAVAARLDGVLPITDWIKKTVEDYTSLGDVTLPSVESNPYDVKINYSAYPIYNNATYKYLMDYGDADSVKTHGYYHTKEYPDGTSNYYTASISPYYNYYTLSGDVLPANLPYREGNPNLFHPDLVLSGDGLYVDIENGPAFEDLVGKYANANHVYVRIAATLISGEGTIGFFKDAADITRAIEGHKASGRVQSDPIKLTVDVPLKDVYSVGLPYFYARNGVMTDMHITLIDDTGPSVTGVNVEKNDGQLVLKMTFNEGLAWADTVFDYEIDNFYIEVYLVNTSGGKNQTLKMFLAGLEGENNNVVVFKGELGDYKYANFYVDKISKGYQRSFTRSTNTPVVDVPDKMYYTPMDYLDLDHNVYTTNEVFSWSKEVISDYAGNPINLNSVVGRKLGQRYNSNSFEAAEVIIYNDVTLEADQMKLEGAPTEWPKDIDKTHMFAGPNNTITVKLTTYTQLTEEEASQVSVKLNIKNPDGTPLIAKCTSSYSFAEDYTVYGEEGGRTMTCLMFENIKLTDGMTMDLAEGETPQIRVAELLDDIANKTAYPYVVEPSRQLFGDFSLPEVSATRLFMTEPEREGGYYIIGIKTTVAEDISNPPYYSGVLQTFAELKLGGKVLGATAARYLVSYNEISQNQVAAKIVSEGGDTVIPVSGTVSLGNYPVSSDRQDLFIYIMVNSGEKLIDGLSLTVDAEDLVGNDPKIERFDISCTIDEVAPAISFKKSAKIDFRGTNDRAIVTIPVVASDYNKVVSLKYAWNVNPDEVIGEEARWLDHPIESGNEIITQIVSGEYGGLDQENKVYNEILFVKATDEYGNESKAIAYLFTVSTEKPQTDAEMLTDSNIPTSKPEIIINGPPTASYDDSLEAFTRVTVSLKDGEWQYVTVIGTGESVDLFSFEGRQWYRVKLSGDRYTAVEEIPIIGNGFTLTSSHEFYELFTYYGDLKVSFENGYGDMTPEVGLVYNTAVGGSYMSDPNYFTVRYAARNPELLEINRVDFGQMIDMVENEEIDIEADPENYLVYNVLRKTSNKGTAAVLFNMEKKRINPMRGTQIYFTLSNLIKSDWKVMDVDFERSYIELRVIDIDGNERVVATEKGFSGAETQFYTVPDKFDDGSDFITGRYYLRVYVYSKAGSLSQYDSSNMVLDASVPENDGIWSYSYQLPLDPENWRSYNAEDEPFASVGVSVSGTDGEIYRSRMFAAYTSGVTGFMINLRTELDVAVLDGFKVGEFEGIRYWNKLSAPTDEEIEAQSFIKQNPEDGIYITTGFDSIYTEETIPKGADGMLDGYGLYLVKGVNTICYQIKMSNGYVSPVKQVTVIVTDKTPVLNIAVQDYVPSHYVYQGEEGITNAHSLKLAVESAYSLNGSGLVDVSVVSTYGMTVGKYTGEGEQRTLDERFYEDPTPTHNKLETIVSGLGDEDFAIVTKNSYTADYPPVNDNLCTMVFVAYDEYGGMTVVAPQIGDHVRVDNWGGSTDYEYNINYEGGYSDDPYTVGRNLTQIHKMYNQPTYYGKIVTGYQNLVSYDNGEWIVMENSLPDLSYNLFNIVTNDVTWGSGSHSNGRHNGLSGSMLTSPNSGIVYSESGNFPGDNFELINWDSAVITFSGGDLESPVTVPLAGGVANDAGYIGGSYYVGSDGIGVFSFNVASVRLPVGKTVEDLEELDELKGVNPETGKEFDISGHFYRNYTIKGYNIYGDYFEESGQVAMYYVDYGVFNFHDRVRVSSIPTGQYYISDPQNSSYGYVPRAVENMTGHGIDLELSFYTLESGITLKTGSFENGFFTKTLTDYYGNKVVLSHTLTKATDTGTKIDLSSVDKTAGNVTVTLERADGTPIYIDITDYAKMSVEDNGTDRVTVTVKENLSFSYKYMDGSDEKMQTIEIDNIVRPEPKILWSFDLNQASTDENGVAYRYGSVTVYIVDDNFELVDRYTGKAPSFTFYPDGDDYYLFEANTIEARLGDDTIVFDRDIAITLPVELRQVTDPLGIFDPITGERIEDTESPGIQIFAYSNLNGYFAEKKLAIQVEGARHSDMMYDRYGYTVFEYSGNIGASDRLLEELGWSTAFRFEIEVIDRSAVRLFIKEGLPESAPDFEKGYSDSIDGVTLNSRLLDVKKAAKFTLFIVDSENNYAAIPFDVTNIGDAPVPSVEKVTLSHERVRIYVIPPQEAGISNFQISSLDIGVEANTDNDPESRYYGMQYVEYFDNDEYIINYSYDYNGSSVEGTVDATVIEINVDKIALDKGGAQWSDNAAAEATSSNVVADLSFTHTVKNITTYGEIDSEKVRFEVSGNKVIVTYLDNHPQIEIIVEATNGSKVPVILNEVSNIDRSAPKITLVSKVLAENGLSVTITMRSDERALFREGGYVGELGDDGYYYYTRRVTENKTYKYIFADMTGLLTEFEVEITEIITGELEMQFSQSPSGDNAVSDPAELTLKIGDVIYVNPSRDVTVYFNGGEGIAASAGEWTEVLISESAGGAFPYIQAFDAYGNVLTEQLSQIQIPDGTAPIISVLKYVYSIAVNSDRDEVRAALLANFTAYDDDPNITFDVEFTDDLSTTGVVSVKYIATDSSGNRSEATGRLRIASGEEPWVYVNGEQIDRDASAILKSGEGCTIKVDAGGRPYKILIKEGVKTVAQMKTGSTIITDYTALTGDISLPELEGQTYYTICIVTQDRDYFRIVIYVE